MILKRLVEERHHISEVKKPHLRKIFPQVLKDPKVREIHSCKPFNLKELPTEIITTLIGGGGGGGGWHFIQFRMDRMVREALHFLR